MTIRWTAPAAADLENINKYLIENYPHLARSTIRSIYDIIGSLGSFPMRGRHGRRSGTRELVLTALPYIITYRTRTNAVEILNIWHNAQDRH